MNVKTINSQLTNLLTYHLYVRKYKALAENVFIFPNMPKSVDIDYMNKKLVRLGSIAFFYDDVLKKLYALPYNVILTDALYNNPTQIEVIGENGYRRKLNEDEFVIMYDNTARTSIYKDIIQFAERISLTTRTIDINIAQQKTPRFYQVPQDKEKSFKDALAKIDNFEEAIATYEDMNIEDFNVVSAPAPYVADKLDIHKEKEKNEFLEHIGITNLTVQKKERNIQDEIDASLGGTVASRFNRFSPRKAAIDEINEKFAKYLDKKIEVKYFDGIPTTEEKNKNLESEGDDNV